MWPPHLYRKNGLSRNIPEDVIKNALDKAFLISEQTPTLPIILSLKHLSELAGASYVYLREIVTREQAKPYRVYRIAKRLSGYRTICVPDNRLLKVQKWIAQNVLNQIPLHPASFAYKKGGGVYDCAMQHCGCRWLIKLDIKRFFESLSEIQAYRVFRRLQYSPLVSFEMARICSRVYEAKDKYQRRTWLIKYEKYPAIPAYYSQYIGHLPQGASTSPMLSNIILLTLDKQLTHLAKQADLVYTRYADDLYFSTGDKTFSRDKARNFIGSVYKEIVKKGMSPKKSKTVIVPPGARKIVLGLNVDGNKPRLSKEFKARIRQHLYYLNKYGPIEHQQKRQFRSVFALKRHLEGLISHVQQIDPALAASYNKQVASIDWPIN